MLAWPCDIHRSIAALELIPVVVAAMLWGDNWHGKLVHFHSDNEAVVSVLNKGHAQDVALIHLMRCLAFLAAFHGFHFSSVHVPGRLNEAADALSRPYFTLSFHRHIRSQSSLVSSSAAGIGKFWTGALQLGQSCSILVRAGGRLFNTILLHHMLEMLLQLLQAVPAPASPTNGNYFMSLFGFFR